ncbi:hypothetical protein GALL_282440 [mine drainage metagenome]|jgi:hypothetical protein|uniref:Beta-ketoacyl synthase-like N-terminal domain-containing protein n=1 Tax=mine drainage metagenome TaxID=410659 RepID=A0A1J5R1N2_9ZZZZ
MSHARAPIRAHIDGIGVLGPGLADWPSAAAVLRGAQSYVAARTVLPAPQLLPPAERRRATAAIKLTLAAGLEALAMAGCQADENLRTVFAASGGDGANCHAICEALTGDDRLISPTRFHNSVHNAASGYWGIATHAMAPSAVISAPHDGSFAAGLIEALTEVAATGEDVLFIAHDTEYPEPLRSVRPIPDNFAVAMLLSARGRATRVACIELDVRAPFTDAPADALDHAELDALRTAIPAARALSLLQRVATGVAATVVVDHMPGPARLALSIAPC